MKAVIIKACGIKDGAIYEDFARTCRRIGGMSMHWWNVDALDELELSGAGGT